MAHYFQGPGVQQGEYESDEEAADDFGQMIDESQAQAQLDAGAGGSGAQDDDDDDLLVGSPSSVPVGGAAGAAGAGGGGGGGGDKLKPRPKKKRTVVTKRIVTTKAEGGGVRTAVVVSTDVKKVGPAKSSMPSSPSHADPEKGPTRRSNSALSDDRSSTPLNNNNNNNKSSITTHSQPEAPRSNIVSKLSGLSDDASATATKGAERAAAAAGGESATQTERGHRVSSEAETAMSLIKKFWDERVTREKLVDPIAPRSGGSQLSSQGAAAAVAAAAATATAGTVLAAANSSFSQPVPNSARSSTSTGSGRRSLSAADSGALAKYRYRVSILHRINNAAVRAGNAEQRFPAVLPIRLRRFHHFALPKQRPRAVSAALVTAAAPSDANLGGRDRANSFASTSATSTAPSSAAPSPLRAKLVVRGGERKKDLLLDSPIDEMHIPGAGHGSGRAGFGFEEDEQPPVAAAKKPAAKASEGAQALPALDNLDAAEAEEVAASATADSPLSSGVSSPVSPTDETKQPHETPLRGVPGVVLANLQLTGLRLRTFFDGSADKFCYRREQRHAQQIHAVTVSKTALSQAAELAAALVMFYQEPNM